MRETAYGVNVSLFRLLKYDDRVVGRCALGLENFALSFVSGV